MSAVITAARVQAASKKAAEREEAIRRLREVIARASAAAFPGLILEARLAYGEIEIASGNRAEGRSVLGTVEKESTRVGFGLIAKNAAASLRP